MKYVLSVALAATFSTVAVAEETISKRFGAGHSAGPSYYIGGAYAHSFTNIDTGGFNTAGGFFNFDCSGVTIGGRTCDDSDNSSGASLFIGIDKIYSFNNSASVRGELEYHVQGGTDYVTGSFPGAPTPTFLYSTSTGTHHAGFVNAYVDVKLPSLPITVYAGGGVGFARNSVTTTDFVVAGAASETDFAFNVGGGARVNVTDHLELFGDVRFVDLGETNVPLVAGGPAGNYTVDHQSTQLRIGLIYKFGSGAFPWN